MSAYGIRTTGSDRIDRATAEIAVALRDASPGRRDQSYYDEAMRLRDEILSGQRELPAPLPPWRAANDGTGKRIWFLVRGWGLESDRVPLAQRYHNDKRGDLIRYATLESAERAAGLLNACHPA